MGTWLRSKIDVSGHVDPDFKIGACLPLLYRVGESNSAPSIAGNFTIGNHVFMSHALGF